MKKLKAKILKLYLNRQSNKKMIQFIYNRYSFGGILWFQEFELECIRYRYDTKALCERLRKKEHSIFELTATKDIFKKYTTISFGVTIEKTNDKLTIRELKLN